MDGPYKGGLKIKVAFVCDWLTGMRGGERCLEAVCEIYPQTDIFTLVHFPGTVSAGIESCKIHTSYIQKLPSDIKSFRRYIPFFSHAIQRFDFTDYDFIMSFSHCIAKNINVPKGKPHICYCFTPMRYAWYMRHEYLSSLNPVKRIPTGLLLNHLRRYDKKTADRVTNFIAISIYVQKRIKDAYNRDSVVIYPPVNCASFNLSNVDDGYFLVVSALVPYKRIDLAIKAFNNQNRKLIVIGNGPELPNLKKIASKNISFIENASDAEVVGYMQKCTALIFPGEEDFGIVPLEAQACGKPVIAFGKGGALETVIGLNQSQTDTPDATGVFFYEQNTENLLKAVQLFEKKRDKINADKCRDNALRFDLPVYKQKIQKFVENTVESFR